MSKLGVFTLVPGLSEKIFAPSENYTFQLVRKMLIPLKLSSLPLD